MLESLGDGFGEAFGVAFFGAAFGEAFGEAFLAFFGGSSSSSSLELESSSSSELDSSFLETGAAAFWEGLFGLAFGLFLGASFSLAYQKRGTIQSGRASLQ